MTIAHIVSFGHHHGPPPVSHVLTDVRWMPNPFESNEFRDLSGLDQPVAEWLFARTSVAEWFDGFVATLAPLLDANRRRDRVTRIGIGCSGGHDRSVAIAEALRARVQSDCAAFVDHRDIWHRSDGRKSP